MSSLIAALALQRVPGLGPRGQHSLLSALGGLSQLACADDRTLHRAGLDSAGVQAYRGAIESGVTADLDWAASDNHHLIHLEDSRYPAAVRELDDAPLTLWALGDPDLLTPPKVAMVGSRNPTTGGIETAEAFARDLAASGLVVVSGLAAGIDAAAHRGALAVDGMTIAVIGTGADRVYPASNRRLAHEIAQHGLLLSEFALGTPPQPSHFPRRNRLISALSTGVLVVEAAVRSGSLITARLAGEQGRAVMAIPGSIHNPMARGSHRLIRDGAKLVESTQDILEEIGPQLAAAGDRPPKSTRPSSVLEQHDREKQTPDSALPASQSALLHWLGHDPVTIDFLVERSGEPAAHVSSVMLMLELGGHVHRQSDGRFCRTAPSHGTIDAC